MPGFFQRFLFYERFFLSFILVSLTLILINQGWFWRWDQTFYDANLKIWSRPPPDDLVIVAIDAASLSAEGAWPWPRQKHAELVRILTDSGAKAIVFDIIFAEPSIDNPAGDLAFSKAIAASGKVILPVLAEQPQHMAQLTETMPVPAFAKAAAGLGHIHFELDADGIARSVYLMEGLGSPHWSSLSLATLRFLEADSWIQLPGVRNPDVSEDAPYSWIRDFHIWIPFAGSPGLFPRISYSQLLRGQFSPEAFQDKIVIIGSTVSGLGDFLPTPVSGFNQSMPGVEIHANLFTVLREKLAIVPLARSWGIAISVLLVLLPTILFPHFSPRWALIISSVLIAATFGLSVLLLRGFQLWFQPMPVILPLVLSYPIWSWRRLEYTMRFLNQELARLHSEPTPLSIASPPQLTSVMELIQFLFPIDGWVLLNFSDGILLGNGTQPLDILKPLSSDKWTFYNQTLWILLVKDGRPARLGLHWSGAENPNLKQLEVLKELMHIEEPASSVSPRGTVEMVQARIQQVQEATSRLRSMRVLISDSFSEMADGVLITDLYGQVLLANLQSASYLQGDENVDLVGASLLKILQNLSVQEGLVWEEAISKVILDSVTVNLYARNQSKLDLFIQISRLALGEGHESGLIVNLTDISPLKESERRRMELLGFLSHDLRSPLVSILALLEMEKDKDQSKTDFKLIKRLENYTQNILELSENFLQLAKAEDLEEAAFYEIDLVDIVINALEQVWPQMIEKKMAINQEFDLSEARLFGEPQMLERAIVNLLTNAIKYSPEGTTAEIQIGLSGKEIFCCVKDNGVGISEEYLPKIFDRFSREKAAVLEGIRGSGLGLAFVNAVMKKHKGRVEVESELSKGSRFCLIIPALTAAETNRIQRKGDHRKLLD